MPGKGQVVVGVLVEVEVGKDGALLVHEEVAKDPELVRVCRKLLLASVVVRLPHQSVPQASPGPVPSFHPAERSPLLGDRPVGGSVIVVCRLFAEGNLSLPNQPVQLEVFKKQGRPALIPKLLWTETVITNPTTRGIAAFLPKK